MPSSSLKKLRLWAASLALVGTLTLVLTEGLVRLVLLPRDFFYFDVKPGEFPFFELKEEFRAPGTTVRQRRRELQERGRRPRRMAWLGDSNLFGTNVRDEESLAERIQAGQSDWDAYNYGVPGYGLPEIRALVSRLAPRGFDLVVYHANFNDVTTAMSLYLPLLTRPGNRLSTVNDYEGAVGRLKVVAKDHFKAFFVLPAFFDGLFQTAQRPPGTPDRLVAAATSCFDALEGLVAPGGRLMRPYDAYGALYGDEALMARVTRMVREMKALVEKAGGRFLVLPHYDLPVLTHLGPEVRERFQRIWRDAGAEVLETWPLYERHYRECGFFSDVGHLGPEGYRYLAEAFLARRKL